MPNLYVAGPVVDSDEKVPELYREIAHEAARNGWSVELPKRQSDVDQLPPAEFTAHVARRISEAEAVVAVLPPGDQSVPVESALAAAAGKPQLVVADGAPVPRLIAGLPGVTDVVKSHDHDAVGGCVGELLNRRHGAEPPTAAH